HAVALAGGARRHEAPAAVAVILALTAANLRGVRGAAAVQDVATVLKFAGVLALALAGLFVARGAGAAASSHAAPASGGALGAVAALVSVLWAFDGWIDVTSIAGEVRDPAKNIPRSLALGTLAVTVLYVLANVAYLRVLGPAGLAATATPAADAAGRVSGGA